MIWAIVSYFRAFGCYMKIRMLLMLALVPLLAGAQQAHTSESIIKKLSLAGAVPEGLLAKRSVVVYEGPVTGKELNEIQKSFQQTGIDAVTYFPANRVLIGADPQRAFANYLISRSIEFIVLIHKTQQAFTITIVPFNGKPTLVNDQASGWQQRDAVLKELLLTVYRFAVSNQKKQNFLINDFPETGNTFKYYDGRRNEAYTTLVKTFKVAVPGTGNEKEDARLEQILKEYLPVKYEIVGANLPEAELEIKGFKTIIRFVHTTGNIARELLEYDNSKVSATLASAAVVNGEPQLKTFPAETLIYKFYIKQLDYGNLFLGNTWDADPDWQQALINHLYLMRQQLNY
ncbi:MAG: hypothetical protein J0L66_05225 [Cytophagales bacterium]|nr:hypothetical protein [Cytophagales bacterium]